MTIATWDPRACFDSEGPDDPARLSVEHHAADGLTVARALGWLDEPLVIGGWSIGIQISLELYAQRPEWARALVLINGAFEHVLSTAFPVPVLNRLVEPLARAAAFGTRLAGRWPNALLEQPWAIDLLKRLRIVTANREFFGEVVGEFRRLDFSRYFPLMLAVNRHSARAVLPTVRVPTLITAGSLDPMTPLAVSEDMHRLIPDSELFVVPNGTHYTTLEYPQIVNLALDDFFRRRVFPGDWD